MNSAAKVLLKCGIRFSISFRWYAFPIFCTQVSRPLAYGVRISSKSSATAVQIDGVTDSTFPLRRSWICSMTSIPCLTQSSAIMTSTRCGTNHYVTLRLRYAWRHTSPSRILAWHMTSRRLSSWHKHSNIKKYVLNKQLFFISVRRWGGEQSRGWDAGARDRFTVLTTVYWTPSARTDWVRDILCYYTK